MTKVARVIGQTREYQEGMKAYDDGIKAEANPYDQDTASALAWRHGWEAEEIIRELETEDDSRE